MYVIRPWLFLGKYRETLELPLLQINKIGAMLQLAGQVEHPSIQTLYLPIEDGVTIPKAVLQQGTDFILANHRQGNNVFISCSAGISRSVTFIIAALKETEDITLMEAYELILKEHPGALPHPALWQSLCTYYHDNSPYWQLLKRHNHRVS